MNERDRKHNPTVAKAAPLTRDEIDRRMRDLLAEVAGRDLAAGEDTDEGMRPRWISPSELVRRIRPYIVYN